MTGVGFPEILTTNTMGQAIRGKVKPAWTATVEWTITFERIEQ